MVLPVRRLESHGESAWQTVQRRGLEGFVANDPESAYRHWAHAPLGSRRSSATRSVHRGREFATWTPSTARWWANGSPAILIYRGVVEWGFRAAHVLELVRAAQYERLRASPFADPPRMRGAVWIAPRFHVEVSYAEVLVGKLPPPV